MEQPEVLVIGSGPAGLAAATAAARAGARVLVIEENRVLGGQYYQRPAPEFPPAAKPLATHTAEAERRIEEAKRAGVAFCADTVAWGVFDKTKIALYRSGDDQSWMIQPSSTVLATGAFERVIPFPGWTLPRVLTPGGAVNLVKFQGVTPGRKVVVAGAGPFLLAVADQLLRTGVQVLAVAEATSRNQVWRFGTRLWRHPARLREAVAYLARLQLSRVPILYGTAVVQARDAGDQLEVVAAPLDGDWHPLARDRRTFTADALCVGYGFVPAVELASLFGCELRFDPVLAAYVPANDQLMETSVPGVFVAGEAAGIGGAFVAAAEGEIAGVGAAWRAGRIDRNEAVRTTALARSRRQRLRRFAGKMNETYRVRPGLYEALQPDTLVCRCEEVPAGAVHGAVGCGDSNVNLVKARTRCGMGMCQGRMCEQNLRSLVARYSGRPLEAVGRFTPRPPLKPVPLASLTGLSPDGH